MKKILSFTDYYWPGYKAGGTIRAFMNQVDYLKGEFAFYIVTRNTDYTETTPYPGIEPDCWQTISDGVHVYYMSAGAQKPKTFYRLLKEQPYDVVYIHLLFGLWFSFLPVILARMAGCRKIIIAPHGVLGKGALGVKPFRKKLFLRMMRLFRFYRPTVFHSVTAHETLDIRKHIGRKTEIAVARELPRKITREPERTPKEAGKLRVVTIARISPEKNQLYALELLTRTTTYPIRYDLIGPVYDESYWNRCQAIVKSLPANVEVTYRGSINSELILNELQQYDLMLLPTTGENFGHTILESFLAGCPVIVSDQTPWKNLEQAGVGRDIPLDRPDEYIRALDFFAAMDPETFRTYSLQAFRYAGAYCANPEMLEENRNLFNR